MAGATVKGLYAGGVETFRAPDGQPLTTAIRKRTVSQALLTFEGLPGDASSETEHHSRDKALHVFASASYADVEQRLERTLPRPAFGENLELSGFAEGEVAIGDQIRVGQAEIVVTQPTERCKTIGRSLGLPRILKVLHELEVCGFYARVIVPGQVAVGDAAVVLARHRPDWTIRRLHQLMFHRLDDEEAVGAALALEELSDDWKRRLSVMRGRRERGEPLSSSLADL